MVSWCAHHSDDRPLSRDTSGSPLISRLSSAAPSPCLLVHHKTHDGNHPDSRYSPGSAEQNDGTLHRESLCPKASRHVSASTAGHSPSNNLPDSPSHPLSAYKRRETSMLRARTLTERNHQRSQINLHEEVPVFSAQSLELLDSGRILL